MRLLRFILTFVLACAGFLYMYAKIFNVDLTYKKVHETNTQVLIQK
jgi:hypothetical protein